MAITLPREAVAREPGRWLLPVVLLGNVLNVLDIFIVNVALPTLSRTLHAGPAALEFVVAGYGVTYACLLVIGGRLGDRYGRRRLYLLGMAGFTVASAACGFAPTTGVLIAARMVQGAAAAVVVPQVLAIVQVSFEGAARQRALGIWGAVMSVAAVFGLIAGGLLIQADVFGLSWRPVFLVNIPVGVVGILAARRIVPESRSGSPAPLDLPGAALLGSAIVLLLVPLTAGREEDWPAWCVAMLAAAPVAAIAFAAVQLRAERAGRLPLLPPSLLRAPGMRRGLPAALAAFASFGGMMFTTTVSLQYGLGFGPIKAGLTLLPYGTAFLVASLLARRISARLGRFTLVGGAVLWAAGLGTQALQAYGGFHGITPLLLAPAQTAIGAGQALTVIPLLGAALHGVPADRTGVAGGSWATAQQGAASFGVAVLGTLLFSVTGWGTASAAAWGTEAALALLAGLLCLRLG